ncbi:MAG: TatD family hydrolase [Chlamydiales bacterium]|nr:TatD family hydrolase [Chlamydiales bacterium]
MFIDSHAHLSGGSFSDEEVDSVLKRAEDAHVVSVINICTTVQDLQRALMLHARYPWVVNTAATTPQDVLSESEETFQFFQEHAKNGSLVAIGETGLDYYFTEETKELQSQVFIRYLHLALECHLPVVIHCRNAFQDLFQILDTEYIQNGSVAPFILHCFTGNVEDAENVLKRGGYLSFSGIVTFKKSEGLKSIAAIAPLEQMLIETDSPYLAPLSKRGKINEPSLLPEIAACIAELKGISVEDVARSTSLNANMLFGSSISSQRCQKREF